MRACGRKGGEGVIEDLLANIADGVFGGRYTNINLPCCSTSATSHQAKYSITYQVLEYIAHNLSNNTKSNYQKYKVAGRKMDRHCRPHTLRLWCDRWLVRRRHSNSIGRRWYHKRTRRGHCFAHRPRESRDKFHLLRRRNRERLRKQGDRGGEEAAAALVMCYSRSM